MSVVKAVTANYDKSKKQIHLGSKQAKQIHIRCSAEQPSHVTSYLKVFDNADNLTDGIGVGYCTLVSHGPQLSKNSNQFPQGSLRDIRPILFQH